MVKLVRKKSNKLKKPKKNKGQSRDIKDFWRSLQNLESHNYGSWPKVVKAPMMLLLLLFIAALAYALPISKKINEISAADAEQETLLEVYKEKESRARYLNEYKIQVENMEVEFNELLNKLPKDTQVSELVEGINMTGIGSGIRFKDISIGKETKQEFFIEQLIRIEALGEYHQLGAFVSGIAALPRIITMHDFVVLNTNPSLNVLPELNFILHTKTYRSKQTADLSPREASDEVEGEGE